MAYNFIHPVRTLAILPGVNARVEDGEGFTASSSVASSTFPLTVVDASGVDSCSHTAAPSDASRQLYTPPPVTCTTSPASYPSVTSLSASGATGKKNKRV